MMGLVCLGGNRETLKCFQQASDRITFAFRLLRRKHLNGDTVFRGTVWKATTKP